MHRCLVTGSSGFIGQELCKTLKEQNFFVRSLFRNKNYFNQSHALQFDEIVFHDFELNNLIAEEVMNNIDTVFHLAGIAHTQNKQVTQNTYWKVNVEATEKLLNLAHKAGVKRFIYFSSTKAAENLKDAYGASKKSAEDKVLEFGAKHGIHVCILRPALVYGPKVKGNLRMMIKGIKQGWFPNLPDTKNKRSLVSTDDLIAAAILCAFHPKANGKIYTITDGHNYSTYELIISIRKALGLPPLLFTLPEILLKGFARLGDVLGVLSRRDFPLNSNALEKLLGSAYFSNQAIQDDLEWSPKYSFHDKIQLMISSIT